MRFTTKQIVYCSVFIALSIVLTRFASFQPIPEIRIGFGNIPIYLSSIVMGPLFGGIVGGVADLLGYWFNPFGAMFNPYITLAAIARGILPALFLMLLRTNKISLVKLTIAMAVTEIVAGLLLTTYGLTFIRGLPFFVLLPPRLITFAVQVPVYSLVTYLPTVRLKDMAWVRTS